MATVRGMGGFCEQNLFYTGPAERPAKRTRKHRDD
jgi:predicted GIY-YIG superfamily endonuclease